MVRTLDSSLRNALNASSYTPAFSLTVEDHVPHYAQYQSPGGSDAWSDACIADDNSIVRVQVTRSSSGFASNFQVQRITDPTQATQWASWTTLAGSAGIMFQEGGCAISNTGGTLRAFAQRGTGGNNLWAWTSTNDGASWSGPVSILVPPAGALLKGIGSAGNNDVFFLYDVSGGDVLGCSFYTAGVWSAFNTWTLPVLASGAGVAVAWSNSIYTVVYSDGYGLSSCTFNPAGNIWNSSSTIAPATSTAIRRIAPRLSFADGLYTLVCIEADTGVLTGAVYSYPRLRQSLDLLHWSNGYIVHDLSSNYGVVALVLPVPNSGTAGARYYLAAVPLVYSAPMFQNTNPAQYLDISASILSYQRFEQTGKPARLEVVLDNAQGTYNAVVATSSSYHPLSLNATMVLSEGYKIGTPDVVQTGTYHLAEIRFVHSPQQSTLVLTGLDLSRNLDLFARHQNSYSNQTLSYLVKEVCARAGLFAVSLPTTLQMSQNVPSFVLQAGQSYRHALDELCATYGLVYFLDQQEIMQFRELANSDPSVWSYHPEIESITFSNNDQRANHIIVTGKPPDGSLFGALTTAEAYDDAHLHAVGVERLHYHIDPKLTSAAQCSQKAAFLLAQAVRSQSAHTVTLPHNPALQLFDVITLTDSVLPGGNVLCRIATLQMSYDAAQALYELQLALEGV